MGGDLGWADCDVVCLEKVKIGALTLDASEPRILESYNRRANTLLVWEGL